MVIWNWSLGGSQPIEQSLMLIEECVVAAGLTLADHASESSGGALADAPDTMLAVADAVMAVAATLATDVRLLLVVMAAVL